MDIVLLVTLRCEDEGLHEASVRAVFVGELAGNLNDYAVVERGM